MSDNTSASTTLGILAALQQKTERDRDHTAAMLREFRTVHIKTREERDIAWKDLAVTKEALEKARVEIAQLTKRNTDLDQQVKVMAAAVEAANSSISESDTMLLDAAMSVRADFLIEGETQQPAPVLRVAPRLAAANDHSSSRPAAQPQNSVAARPSPANTASAPSLLQAPSSDSLDASMLEIEQLLHESLRESGVA